MRIKLAILEQDQSYLTRIVSVFSTKYADKFEIYSFTDQAAALSLLDSARIDILIASDEFDVDVSALPKRCGFAYFVSSNGVESVKDQKAICKFQKAELIYKEILNIYSEKAGSLFGMRQDDDSTKVMVFTSPGGGTGASSMAAACALHFAGTGKRTLYLNLENYGSSDAFFKAEGQFNISDIIYALKSKKANLALKLESCVKQDISGVCFYSQSKLALDMLELNGEDKQLLISELKASGSYQYIIIDMDFSLDKDAAQIQRAANGIVWVGDGSEISNRKLRRAYEALTIREQNADLPLTNRLMLLYNKFSNKTSTALEDLGIKNIGGAPRYEHMSTGQILEQLSRLTVFDKII